MMTKSKLQSRVSARKQEWEAANTKHNELMDQLNALMSFVKSNAVVYNLIKALPVWKELEKLLPDSKAE